MDSVELMEVSLEMVHFVLEIGFGECNPRTDVHHNRIPGIQISNIVPPHCQL